MIPTSLRLVLAATTLLAIVSLPALAHEVRPAYWEIREVETDVFETLWKQPVLAGQSPGWALRLPVDPVMPASCEAVAEPLVQSTGRAIVRTARFRCPGGLGGAELRVEGLRRTLMDVLLRVELLDAPSRSVLIDASEPVHVLDAGDDAPVPAYLALGVEHMLLGFDHLLFVLGLVLLSRRVWEVVRLVTAFTVAHSITLALSALDLLTLPQGPVEAVIALSILFLAVEALQPPRERSFLARRSWVVAFGFGLLHGCGFAGALAEIGLPRDAALPALFLFNVGVEIGQIATVLVLLGAFALARRAADRDRSVPSDEPVLPLPLQLAAAGMATVASFWFVERTVGLL